MKINEYVLSHEYCLSPEHVTEDDVKSYLALLLRLAKLGGVTMEESGLINLIVTSLGVEEEIARTAAEVADDASIDLEALTEKIRGQDYRACAYRDAYRVALVDGVVSPEERSFLADAAESMGLTAETTRQLREIVSERTAVQRKFEELLVQLAD